MWKKRAERKAKSLNFAQSTDPTMAQFKYLYYLKNPNMMLIEIKRTDLEQHSPIAESFKWLWINKMDNSIIQLDFSFMDSSGEI